MEPVITAIGCFSSVLVPVLALWAITCLYTQEPGCRCCITEGAYLLTLLLIAGVTVRTIAVNDHCWLIHTASLGMVTVAGVMKRPVADVEGSY